MERMRAGNRAVTDEGAMARRVLFLAVWVLLVVVAASKVLLRPGGLERLTTMQRMQAIEEALDHYAVDNGGMVPTTRQGLKALRTEPTASATDPDEAGRQRCTTGPLPPNWHGPYLPSDDLLKDGWDRPFQYAAPGGYEPTRKGVSPASRTYDVWSLGADGREGGRGANASIRSWEAQTQVP